MKKLLIVSDAWEPQTNGVVTTLKSVIDHLPDLGLETHVIHPGLFRTVPLPSYREILVVRDPWRMSSFFETLQPDYIHITTEGPLGLYARRLSCRQGLAFTTSLHTKFPEYVNERLGLPPSVGYRFIRWFHAPATRTLCTTPSHRQELEQWGLSDLVVWGRSVDTERFRPMTREPRSRPRLLYVGRVAVEKNIEAFLDLDVDADKVVVGDGPARAALQTRYPHVHWPGMQKGEPLVRFYADADAFVFPSLTDTFGLVLLEAMATGTPVAAFPVTGPRDVVVPGRNGYLSTDLGEAVRRALDVDRNACRSFAEQHSWQRTAERLAESLAPVNRFSRRPQAPLAGTPDTAGSPG